MPNPINRIVPDPHILLDTGALADKPDMAIIVTEIFATWAGIEHDLSLLLVRILGAVESPAVAMFSILTAQHLQMKALEAAAKAALSREHYQVFLAVMAVVDSAQTPRNHLAHWIWAKCEQRPDLLALANPSMIKDRDLRVAKFFESLASGEETTLVRTLEIYQFDVSEVLAYSKTDLERASRDLKEAKDVLFEFEFYLQPTNQSFLGFISEKDGSPDEIRARMLDRLNGRRLFREALARIRADQQSTQQQLPESPEPRPGEK